MAFGVGLPGIDCFELILLLVENLPYIIGLCVIGFFIVKRSFRIIPVCFVPGFILINIIALVLGGYEDHTARGFDMSLPSKREAVEAYIATGEGDLEEIINGNKNPSVFGYYELRYLLTDLLSHTLLHLDSHNGMNIPVAYNKGNDWFRATLGEPMVYTSGIYPNYNETLRQGQDYKMDYVAHAIDVKRGDKILDIGCGWGPLVKHLTEKYGAEMTGVTLSKSQYEFATQVFNKDNGAKVLLQDAMQLHSVKGLVPKGGFDKITCLEMAEHVGIARYDEFLSMVHTLLKDDGIFYFQVAGLRRKWQYEDLVWGLFMGENIFPGADASCPMGWVVTHLERNGFEVQRVQNLGLHYVRTIQFWLEEWRSYKEKIIASYGVLAFRRWEVFLAWSCRIGTTGSSNVYMITATKFNQPIRIDVQKRLAPSIPTPQWQIAQKAEAEARDAKKEQAQAREDEAQARAAQAQEP